MIEFRGHCSGNVIVPDEPVEIPQNCLLRVTVEAMEVAPCPHSSRDALLRLAREAECLNVNLPADLALHHDHYLHGAPKR